MFKQMKRMKARQNRADDKLLNKVQKADYNVDITKKK